MTKYMAVLAAAGFSLMQLAAAPAPAPDSEDSARAHENLNAVLWMQTAAEYRAICVQTWRAAEKAWMAALADRSATAALEQAGVSGFGTMPPAVVVDVDETVLDNGPFQARLVDDDAAFSSTAWDAWVRERLARPVPGALGALNRAARKGITIFYVSNRVAAHEEPTRENLRRYGFPIAEEPDVVLLKGEQEDWGSDKTTRRRVVARTHRILAIVGDDLNDFLGVSREPTPLRNRLARELGDRWGREWHMLPNPTYGSWERALYGHEDLPRKDVVALKRRLLETRRKR